VPSPKLNLASNLAAGLEFRWPNTSSAWTLEETENLHAGPWMPVLLTPIRTNGESRITLDTPAGDRFYRLKRN